MGFNSNILRILDIEQQVTKFNISKEKYPLKFMEFL